DRRQDQTSKVQKERYTTDQRQNASNQDTPDGIQIAPDDIPSAPDVLLSANDSILSAPHHTLSVPDNALITYEDCDLPRLRRPGSKAPGQPR
ncbi:MAG: hypothetical protein ACKVHE_02680, partial [Planctomycetales bacterium]